MRYIRIIPVLVLLLWGSAAIAQKRIYVQPRMGYGTYQMDGPKEMQQMLIGRTGVNARVTDAFGPNYQPGGGIKVDVFKIMQAGLFYEQGSTGGRVAYEDYSGAIRADMLHRFRAAGVAVDVHRAVGGSRLSVLGGLEGGLVHSTMDFEVYTRIHSQTEHTTEAFEAIGYGIKPHLGLQYPILKLPLVLTLGYLKQFGEAYHLAGNKEIFVIRNENYDKLKPDWSGLRIHFSIALPIFSL